MPYLQVIFIKPPQPGYPIKVPRNIQGRIGNGILCPWHAFQHNLKRLVQNIHLLLKSPYLSFVYASDYNRLVFQCFGNLNIKGQV